MKDQLYMGTNHKKYFNDYRDAVRKGRLTSDEKDALREDIQVTFRDEELEQLMSEHWNQQAGSPVSKEDLYFRTLQQRIWNQITDIEENEASTKKTISSISVFAKFAAVLLIPLLLTTIYLFDQFIHPKENSTTVEQELYANLGTRSHFVLPDGTDVWLNSGSKLAYYVEMNERSDRKVKLSGQAYFQVTHDESHPFIVETSELNICVLGTVFDVADYPEDQVFTATLQQGAIAITNRDGKEITRLAPGEQAVLNKNSRKLIVASVDAARFSAWKEGKLVFKETRLEEVAKQLERWFNCSIQIAPDLLNSDIEYTATIENETLDEVLLMLEISTSLKTIRNGRNISIVNQ